MSYDWTGMQKITYEEAVDRWNKNHEVYLIYDDETEAVAESLEDIKKHHEKYSGEFGYEKEDGYYYGMRLRGFSPMCQPKEGFIRRENDTTGKYYDIIVYNRRLTDKEVNDYELDRL